MPTERVPSRSRMFQVGGKPMKTWNVFVGCDYHCTYCNARKTALTRLKNSPRYKEGFTPHLIESELTREFRPGDFVFVSYMGDIAFAERPVVGLILSQVRNQPDVNFLFCTKNPLIYRVWHFDWPDNLYLGATIETNRQLALSQAPPPWHRYEAMRDLDHPNKFISIEPICDFDPKWLLRWMRDINPEIVEVGADNYHNNLPEPRWEKVEWLLLVLEEFCPTVVRKVGLERLKQ